ncbi:MAG: DNA repair protein RadC [Candidatus Pacebacteria bacterium]|nr:DNA repair protein RadC [Candidatus Paceibacterota bacterium]
MKSKTASIIEPEPEPEAAHLASANDASNQGHRQRIRQKFLQSNGADLLDYELLELLLFGVNARRDMKPLAKKLIKEFKSFSGVITAPSVKLLAVEGVGEAALATIKLVEVAAQHLARQRILNRPVLAHWAYVLDYCQATMGHEEIEQFRILFLDIKNNLIGEKIMWTGTINHTPVYMREVVKKCLEVGAAGVILVHNHPSGDPRPSQADIDLTETLVKALKLVDIAIHDHLIICRSGHYSFKTEGLL